MTDGEANLIKKNVALTDSYYSHPGTSTLVFQFAPHLFSSSAARLQGSAIQHGFISGKDLYIVDNFFTASEGLSMRDFSEKASFSRFSYGSPEAVVQGQEPARSMNGKERWQFFAKPPRAMAELYKLFSTLSAKMDAEISTLPWELCDSAAHSSPAVIANRLETASQESREAGRHQDINPEDKISFGIPILYSNAKEDYPSTFVNGAPGKPWLISILVYTTKEGFLPEYGLGTAFFDDGGEVRVRANCLNMRLVLFQGDLFHSMEEALHLPVDRTWRVSYVFKLIVNPRKPDQDLKASFLQLMKEASDLQSLQFGPHTRA